MALDRQAAIDALEKLLVLCVQAESFTQEQCQRCDETEFRQAEKATRDDFAKRRVAALSAVTALQAAGFLVPDAWKSVCLVPRFTMRKSGRIDEPIINEVIEGKVNIAAVRNLAGEVGKAIAGLRAAAGKGEQDGPWSRPKSPKDWAKVFGFSRDTFIRRCEDGTIRHKKLSDRRYLVHLDDVPAPPSKSGNSAQVGTSRHK